MERANFVVSEEVINPNSSLEFHVYDFQFGNKHLQLTFDPATMDALSLIENCGEERVRGATTVVYSAARDKLQELAESSGKSVRYVFETDFFVMKDWARSQGEAVFRWDSIDEQGDTLYAQRIFQPSHDDHHR